MHLSSRNPCFLHVWIFPHHPGPVALQDLVKPQKLLRIRSDQIRSDYISSSHTRLITCLTHWGHHCVTALFSPINNSHTTPNTLRLRNQTSQRLQPLRPEPPFTRMPWPGFKGSAKFAGFTFFQSLGPTLSPCFPPTHLMQASIDKPDNSNYVLLPHECLHRLWPLKQVRPLLPEAQQAWTLKDKVPLITQCTCPAKLANPVKSGNFRPSP